MDILLLHFDGVPPMILIAIKMQNPVALEEGMGCVSLYVTNATDAAAKIVFSHSLSGRASEIMKDYRSLSELKPRGAHLLASFHNNNPKLIPRLQ